MIITGLLLFLFGTNFSYSYPSANRHEHSSVSEISISEKNSPIYQNLIHQGMLKTHKTPCHTKSTPTKEATKHFSHPCEARDDIQSEQEESNIFIPAEIPPAPAFPPLKLSESPIVVLDEPESPEIDIEEKSDPCPPEIADQDVKETPILPKLPTPPELPPLVSVDKEEDCDNVSEESISPPRKPSKSYDIVEESEPCPPEIADQDVKETQILPNLSTPPELAPLVSVDKEEDCDNVSEESISPPRKPSQSYDTVEESDPCPPEIADQDEKETPILPNLPTPPELPPLVSVDTEEDCDNVLEESIPPPRKPSQAFELPSKSYDTQEDYNNESEESIPTPDSNDKQDCNSRNEEAITHVVIPPPPEIPNIALPKLPLDIVLPQKEKTEVKVPLPSDCVRNIVVKRVIPNIICRKTNSSNKVNLIPNPACKNIE